MAHYLTRAPVAIETFDDVGKSYKPYEQFYRPPTHAAYSNGYRMSPYHKDAYGPQEFDGFGGSSSDITEKQLSALTDSVRSIIDGAQRRLLDIKASWPGTSSGWTKLSTGLNSLENGLEAYYKYAKIGRLQPCPFNLSNDRCRAQTPCIIACGNAEVSAQEAHKALKKYRTEAKKLYTYVIAGEVAARNKAKAAQALALAQADAKKAKTVEAKKKAAAKVAKARADLKRARDVVVAEVVVSESAPVWPYVAGAVAAVALVGFVLLK